MSSMTLGQASDALRGLAEIIREHGTCAPMAVEHVADAIDANLAGMGEPVAHGDASLGRCKACGRATRAVCDGLDGNGLGCTNAPSVDLAAVRDVIDWLRSGSMAITANAGIAANKLEAAIKGEG